MVINGKKCITGYKNNIIFYPYLEPEPEPEPEALYPEPEPVIKLKS